MSATTEAPTREVPTTGTTTTGTTAGAVPAGGAGERAADRLVASWLRLWNGDAAQAGDLVADGFRLHAAMMDGGDGSAVDSAAALVAWIAQTRGAVPDLTFAVEVGPIVDGDLIALRWSATGTYAGGVPGAGAPVGTRVAFTGSDLLRVADGRLAEYWVNSDTLLLLTQLQALPATAPTAAPVAHRRPAYLRPTNAVVRLLSRLGVSTGVIELLTVPGRTSGLPRSTPVSPLRLDGRRFVLAPLPQGDWARNARAAGRGTLADGRRTEDLRLRELDATGEAELRRRLMVAFPAAVPDGVRFFKALGLVQSADPAEFAAVADRVTAFELLPVVSA